MKNGTASNSNRPPNNLGISKIKILDERGRALELVMVNGELQRRKDSSQILVDNVVVALTQYSERMKSTAIKNSEKYNAEHFKD